MAEKKAKKEVVMKKTGKKLKEEKQKTSEKEASTSKTVFDPYKIIKFPLTTEKGVRLMESENKLLFVVDNGANKSDIKKSIEKMFNAKIVSVNTFVTAGAQKRALVKFAEETPAIDIATQLGLI